MNDLFKQLNQLISGSGKILLVGHRRPDQDTLGAVLAFNVYLSDSGKRVTFYTPDPAPSYLSFLPNIERLSSDAGVFEAVYDLIIFLDCASLDMAGITAETVAGKNTVVIDHHISNPGFGKLNIIDPKASSASEVVYRYLDYINFPIDRRIATCLLSGILADTGGFSNSATNSEAVIISSELVKKGVKVHQLFNYVMHNKSLGGLKLWGEVLSRLKINRELNVAYTYLKDDDFINFGASEEEFEGLANFLNILTDVSATAVFRIYPDKVKASWRTKRDDVDLSKLCGIFGGGGHKKASGFTVNWKVVEKNGELVVI